MAGYPTSRGFYGGGVSYGGLCGGLANDLHHSYMLATPLAKALLIRSPGIVVPEGLMLYS